MFAAAILGLVCFIVAIAMLAVEGRSSIMLGFGITFIIVGGTTHADSAFRLTSPPIPFLLLDFYSYDILAIFCIVPGVFTSGWRRVRC